MERAQPYCFPFLDIFIRSTYIYLLIRIQRNYSYNLLKIIPTLTPTKLLQNINCWTHYINEDYTHESFLLFSSLTSPFKLLFYLGIRTSLLYNRRIIKSPPPPSLRPKPLIIMNSFEFCAAGGRVLPLPFFYPVRPCVRMHFDAAPRCIRLWKYQRRYAATRINITRVIRWILKRNFLKTRTKS